MKINYLIGSIIGFAMLLATCLEAAIFNVNSQFEFENAHDLALSNDSIIWEVGTHSDIYMDITKSNLFIGAAILGGAIFTGASKVRIRGDYITLEGLQFIGGNIGTDDIINTYGSYNHFNQLNLKDYTCYKYLRIREECQYVRVTYCNFENRINLDDQNILSVLVDDVNPGYHKIQHCSFKNFDGTGNDLGIEPIRIGLSFQADLISRSLVEYCYFTKCNGDGELISSKARQNVYRYNTFENNPLAELVLRHGSEGIVYGNFFLNGKGGVRVREGQNHYIYNNYFYELDDRAIYLQNEDSDPLDNIHIAFNTIVDCSEVILGGNGNNKPTNVFFTNNILADPDDDLFEKATGTETWNGNMVHGDLGISLPPSGMVLVDPELIKNSAGFFGLASGSPAIDAALPGYLPLPQFPGMDPIDVDVVFDLMGQERPSTIEEKDLGCSEFPYNVTIQPIATEENTGPSYDTSIGTYVEGSESNSNDLITLSPNPSVDQVTILFDDNKVETVGIDIYNLQGSLMIRLSKEQVCTETDSMSINIASFQPGVYVLYAKSFDRFGRIEKVQTINLVKL